MWREASACRAACLLALCILESQGRFQAQSLQGGCETLDFEEDASPAFAAVQLTASLHRSSEVSASSAGLVEPSCLLAAPGLSAAIHRFLGKLDRSPAPASLVEVEVGEVALAEAATRAGCNLASLSLTKQGSDPRLASAARRLISLVDSLGGREGLRLMPSSEARNGSTTNTTFFFESVDEASGRVGTGMLGQGCGDKSVSEVAITVTQDAPFLWTNLTGAGMSFKIGPPCAGTYLISGQMWPTKATAEGISGKIRAGFVNLRSTMTGTWSTGPSGLLGNLTVAFQELLEVEWTWKPEPSEPSEP
ncbi:PSL4 [Symbiodinium sp. CCMP2592]|nr:PSL4 [Symbiodinium sp. CCMP2592]